MAGYVLDNGWERERERLAGLEHVYDPSTTRHMATLGVRQGWCCLEVGGGGGSVTKWLCRRVGGAGSVVATDIDPRFLYALDEDNLEVWHHDVVTEDLPEDRFDLVHARLLLEHLPERDKILERLVGALRPGGWVLIEDLDWRALFAEPPIVTVRPQADLEPSVRIFREMVRFMVDAGYDLAFGARLPELMADLGLEEVSAEGRNPLYRGGTPASVVPRFTLEQFQVRLLDRGGVTPKEVDWVIARFDNPEYFAAVGVMVSAWGRRPPVAGADAPPAPPPQRGGETLLERLSLAPLFAECSAEELDRVVSLANSVHAERGEVIVREGEPGDLFYVVVSGQATVRSRRRRLAVLGPGSFFGETALLTGGPRTATVTAHTKMELATFDRGAFDALLGDSPAISRAVLGGIARRSAPRASWLWP